MISPYLSQLVERFRQLAALHVVVKAAWGERMRNKSKFRSGGQRQFVSYDFDLAIVMPILESIKGFTNFCSCCVECRMAVLIITRVDATQCMLIERETIVPWAYCIPDIYLHALFSLILRITRNRQTKFLRLSSSKMYLLSGAF